MSEMVERSARAMFEAHTFNCQVPTWEQQNEDYQEIWRRHARAAIAAMREPTEAMIEAGWASANEENAANTWRDMISEALK